MAICINQSPGNFTMINNAIMWDYRLTSAQRGVLLTLISLPSSWKFSVSGLMTVLPDKVDMRNVLCEDGIIINTNSEKNIKVDQIVDLQGNYLLAGFVDLHVHGGGGSDFMDGDIESMKQAVDAHLNHGTTTIFPTTMSAKWEDVERTVQIYKKFV